MIGGRFIMVDFQIYTSMRRYFKNIIVSLVDIAVAWGFNKDKRRRKLFFLKLLGITFSDFSSKQYLRGTVFHNPVPPRYKTLSISISFLKTLTPFQSCMAIQLSMTANAAIRIVLTLQSVYTLPTTNIVNAGNHSRIARRQYTSVGILIQTFHYVNASTISAQSTRLVLPGTVWYSRIDLVSPDLIPPWQET